MASEPFIDYKPHMAAVALGDESSSQGSLSETDPLVEKKRGKGRRRKGRVTLSSRSIVMVNVSSTLDGCDDQLLPATFRALERDLGFHPSLLGYITLSQTLCLSLLCPFWGYLADRHSRKWLLAFGTTAWGVTTTLLGLVSDFWQVATLRALNGVFLGSVGPVSQSILADSAPRKSLGFSFGLVQFCSCMGRLVGGVVTTSVALVQVGATKGWRVCFYCVGCASVILGILVAILLDEVPRKNVQRIKQDDIGGTGSQPAPRKDWQAFMKDMFSQSLATPSVLLVVAEGLVGTVPWSAFSFNTMFFQYCNMSDVEAAFITGALLIGAAVGGVGGGLLGDRLFQWSPCHGRPLVGQIAMAMRVPLLIIAYVVVPKNREYFGAFFVIALIMGLSSMAGVAVNRPILADVVRPDHKATVFSITVALEGSSAAILGAPLVGFLAENVFGYVRTTFLVADMPESLRVGNANALAYALVFLTAVPWTLSFFIYGLLHFTYGKDQIRVNKIISEEYEALPEDSPRGLIGSDADSSNETMAGAGGWQQVDGDSSAGNNSA